MFSASALRFCTRDEMDTWNLGTVDVKPKRYGKKEECYDKAMIKAELKGGEAEDDPEESGGEVAWLKTVVQEKRCDPLPHEKTGAVELVESVVLDFDAASALNDGDGWCLTGFTSDDSEPVRGEITLLQVVLHSHIAARLRPLLHIPVRRLSRELQRVDRTGHVHISVNPYPVVLLVEKVEDFLDVFEDEVAVVEGLCVGVRHLVVM